MAEPPSTPAGRIRIGALLPLSGSEATFGANVKEGIDLATAEINARGGIHRARIEVVYQDDRSIALDAAKGVRKLASDDAVVAIVGEIGSARSMAAGLVAETERIPMLTPTATHPDVTKGRTFVFRSCLTDPAQARAAAHFVFRKLGKRRAAILSQSQDLYSSGLAQEFRDAFTKMSGTIVVEQRFAQGETNFTTYLAQLKAAKPEVIFAPLYYSDMVPIVRQARALGLAGSMFFGADGWDSPTLLDGAGAELEGAHLVNPWAPDLGSERARAAMDGFRSRYKREIDTVSAQGYQAAWVLFDAIDRSGDMTRQHVLEALASTKDFAAPFGRFTMGPSHDPIEPELLIRIHQGRFTYEDSTEAGP